MRPGTVRRDRWVQHITGHHDTASMRPGTNAGISLKVRRDRPARYRPVLATVRLASMRPGMFAGIGTLGLSHFSFSGSDISYLRER